VSKAVSYLSLNRHQNDHPFHDLRKLHVHDLLHDLHWHDDQLRLC
jgi:hypothetical protein